MTNNLHHRRMEQLTALREHQVRTAERQVQAAKRALVVAKEAHATAQSDKAQYDEQMHAELKALEDSLIGKPVKTNDIEKSSLRHAEMQAHAQTLVKTIKETQDAVAARDKDVQTQRVNLTQRRRAQQKMQHVQAALGPEHALESEE